MRALEFLAKLVSSFSDSILLEFIENDVYSAII